MIDDLRYVLVFAKIAATGSISKGAQALNLSAATASAHLRKLEQHLGTALLYRNTRKLRLTPAGERLYQSAHTMLVAYEEALGAVGHTSQQQSLRFAVPSVLIQSGFHTAIAEFLRQHPDVHTHITYSDVRTDLIEDDIDVAFRIGNLVDSRTKAKPVWHIPRQLVGHPHLFNGLPTIKRPEDLANMPWIALTQMPTQRQLTHTPTGEQLNLTTLPTLFVDNVEAAYRLAVAGVGLFTPPTWLCQNDVAQGVLWHVLPEWTVAPLHVHAQWHANLAHTSPAYALIQHLAHSLQDA